MSVVSGLTMDDSSTIGFVLDCLYSEAIDMAELRKWCEFVIVSNDMESIPDYMFDLVSFDGGLSKVVDCVGFSPAVECHGRDEYALYGIAYLRGRDVYDPPVTFDDAESALVGAPHILERFKSTFPFIVFGE
ncbi:hypothetical protein [Nocardia tengchongensis]|uniref:hypothetical protein n=1 Tax=Nocardia tengchongensis TaxID=2055889 RepID=UPI0036528013